MKYFHFILKNFLIFALFFLTGVIAIQYAQLKWPLRKACLYIWSADTHNIIFNKNIFYKKLKDEFSKRGYDLATQDIHPAASSDIIFSVHVKPPVLPPKNSNKVYIWVQETPFVTNLLYDKSKHHLYEKIFTYNKELIDNKKFHYLQLTYTFDPYEEIDLNNKDVLAMQIASNLNYYPKRSLYYERRNLVKWFVENQPQDFEFYGNYWNLMKNNIKGEAKQSFGKCYKGYVANKKETAKRAKFVFAYENSLSENYISEKIWDVMNAGSVPVYLGADNIEEYVPKNCFINKKDFDSYEKLYVYLKNMSDETYLRYISCIKNFVMQPHDKSEVTDVDGAVERVVRVIFEKEKFIDRFIYFIN